MTLDVLKASQSNVVLQKANARLYFHEHSFQFAWRDAMTVTVACRRVYCMCTMLANGVQCAGWCSTTPMLQSRVEILDTEWAPSATSKPFRQINN